MSNFFANPLNGIDLTSGVNCGCVSDNPCAANFDFTFDPVAEELTLTDKSFLADGDSIVLVTGIQVNVQDADVPTPTAVAGSGDATADIVISTATLDPSFNYYRIDYDITTVNGCTSSAVLFFDPNTVTSGSTDPYSAIR